MVVIDRKVIPIVVLSLVKNKCKYKGLKKRTLIAFTNRFAALVFKKPIAFQIKKNQWIYNNNIMKAKDTLKTKSE